MIWIHCFLHPRGPAGKKPRSGPSGIDLGGFLPRHMNHSEWLFRIVSLKQHVVAIFPRGYSFCGTAKQRVPKSRFLFKFSEKAPSALRVRFGFC